MTQAFDVCIRGGGMVGRTLALLLARERLRVGLVAPAPRTAAGGNDVRAYALNLKSKHLLDSLRCWPAPEHASAVLHMQVKGDAGGEVNFDAADQQAPALAWIVDVPVLEARLAEAVRFQPLIEMLDAPQPATLTVVCEGRASHTRAELGIDFDVTPYPQQAIAARLTCEKPHTQTAYQWFSHGEILAFLPLDGPLGNSVAIVWSVSPERAKELQAVSAADFCAQLQALSQDRLGQLTLTTERVAWPLQLARADRWVGTTAGKAWALAGDAAHNVHPLTGQGLNLGLADVAELAKVIHERDYWRNVDDVKVLRRYERSRKADVLAMATATDGLQLLFAQADTTWQTLRNRGMDGFERSGPLKQWMARQAMGL